MAMAAERKEKLLRVKETLRILDSIGDAEIKNDFLMFSAGLGEISPDRLIQILCSTQTEPDSVFLMGYVIAKYATQPQRLTKMAATVAKYWDGSNASR